MPQTPTTVPAAQSAAALPATVRRPWLIQGGMGVGVSGWRLARAVSREGQLGVVSGTALDVVLARVLQSGDPGGHARRALAAFPLPELARTALDCYFRPDGLSQDAAARMRTTPRLRAAGGSPAELLTVLGNFVEVWLAKEGHDGVIGVNYLEKVQLATAPAMFGAILAGVDHVLVGAGAVHPGERVVQAREPERRPGSPRPEPRVDAFQMREEGATGVVQMPGAAFAQQREGARLPVLGRGRCRHGPRSLSRARARTG